MFTILQLSNYRVSDCYLALKQDSTFFFQGNITDVTSFMLDKEKRAEERNQMLTALTMEYSTVIMGDLMENTMVVVKHDGKMYNPVFDSYITQQ